MVVAVMHMRYGGPAVHPEEKPRALCLRNTIAIPYLSCAPFLFISSILEGKGFNLNVCAYFNCVPYWCRSIPASPPGWSTHPRELCAQSYFLSFLHSPHPHKNKRCARKMDAPTKPTPGDSAATTPGGRARWKAAQTRSGRGACAENTAGKQTRAPPLRASKPAIAKSTAVHTAPALPPAAMILPLRAGSRAPGTVPTGSAQQTGARKKRRCASSIPPAARLALLQGAVVRCRTLSLREPRRTRVLFPRRHHRCRRGWHSCNGSWAAQEISKC